MWRGEWERLFPVLGLVEVKGSSVKCQLALFRQFCLICHSHHSLKFCFDLRAVRLLTSNACTKSNRPFF